MPWTTPGTATAGEVLTAAFWNTQVRDNLAGLYEANRQFGTVSRTDMNGLVITATSFATASELFSSDITWTAVSGTTYVVEFFIPLVYTTSSTSTGFFNLTDGGSSSYGFAYTEQAVGTGRPVYFRRLITPGAGSKSVNVRVHKSGGNLLLYGGTGATDADYMPAFLRVMGNGVVV